MGSSYLDTEKITQYGWSGTTSTQTANILSLSLSSPLLALIVSEQTLPAGSGSLAGDCREVYERCMRRKD